MAWAVERSSLSRETGEMLRKELYFPPKVSYSGQEGKPLLCLASTEKQALLPFAYGRKVFPKVHSKPRTSFSFLGQPKTEQVRPLQEAIYHLSSSGSVLLELPTGFGKTVCATYLAPLCASITCVTYPLVILEDQWLKTFSTLTNAVVWVNGTRPPENWSKVQVILSMQGKLEKIPEEILSRIGCLIVDEAHAFCTTKRYARLLKIQPEFLIGLTATPDREDGMGKALILMFKNFVRTLTQKKARVYKCYTQIAPVSKKQKNGKLDWNALLNDLAASDVRNQQILRLIAANSQHKILVLTSRKAHARELSQLVAQTGEKVALMIGGIKNYSDSRVLVGTAGKLGTGFDEEAACKDFQGEKFDLLILAFSTKSVSLLTQLFGRVFRSGFPLMIDMVDNHGSIAKHWKIRENYYRSKNYEIEEILAPS